MFVVYCLAVVVVRFVGWFFFFFQAEDGIRDVERSRGLGDVYKRQGINAEYMGVNLWFTACFFQTYFYEDGMEKEFVKKIKIMEQAHANQLFGEHNKNLLKISDSVPVNIQSRGNEVMIKGEPEDVEFASKVIKELCSVIKNGYPVYPRDVEYAVQILSKDENTKLKDVFLDTVFVSSKSLSLIHI
eukprot:TRINITY_DN31655_c0_g1_i1.p1 TRINITY_DN31655_c0_g1~~TRINITY_DN31655_c0_g1_i1.p1  ORF type:complete len:186 (-),score=47.16 TRINITY_DN31655_c0_g1_i1:158-715(-)